jgi:hypothetical protein
LYDLLVLASLLYVRFLNGFWKDVAEAEAENIWNFANKFIELDPKKKQGNELGNL